MNPLLDYFLFTLGIFLILVGFVFFLLGLLSLGGGRILWSKVYLALTTIGGGQMLSGRVSRFVMSRVEGSPGRNALAGITLILAGLWISLLGSFLCRS